MHRRDRALAWALPAVLIAVALTQITWAHTRDLTPWKGGGFGMFASVDLLTYRPIKAEFDTEVGPIAIDVHDFREASDRVSKLYTNARGLPDERRLGHLVDQMARAEWVVDGGVAEFHAWLDDPDAGPVVRDEDERRALQVYGVDLEVWRVTYERHAEFIEPELIIELWLPFEEAGAFAPHRPAPVGPSVATPIDPLAGRVPAPWIEP